MAGRVWIERASDLTCSRSGKWKVEVQKLPHGAPGAEPLTVDYSLLVRNPLLSPYRGGENRVTSSTMAVFERVDLALVQEILESAVGGGGELRTVTFENQVTDGDKGVPDAKISGRFTWWFETKTERGCYAREGHGRAQVRRHSERLLIDPEALLFVLTPDAQRPPWFNELDGVEKAARDRVLWLSFRDLADAVNAIITDSARVIGEQTRFLLAELTALYETDGLLTTDDTVIVAARRAWPEYQMFDAYICQPERAFRDGLTHFGFYAEGAIQRLIPQIRSYHQKVDFTREEAARLRAGGCADLANLIEKQLDGSRRPEGESFGVVLLSAHDDPVTVDLGHAIANDLTTKGRTWAWTLSQRYTRLDRLKSGVERTSEL